MKNVAISILSGIVFNQYLLGTWFQNFLGISLTLCVALCILDFAILDYKEKIERRKGIKRTIQRLCYEKNN